MVSRMLEVRISWLCYLFPILLLCSFDNFSYICCSKYCCLVPTGAPCHLVILHTYCMRLGCRLSIFTLMS